MTVETLLSNTCPNCKNTLSNLDNKYCSNCGQKLRHFALSFKEMFLETMEYTTNFSIKVTKTIFLIIAKPDIYLRDFIAARRKRNSSPIRVLFALIFAAFLLTTRSDETINEFMAQALDGIDINIAQIEVNEGTGQGTSRTFNINASSVSKYLTSPQSPPMDKTLPLFAFIIIPFFAFITQGFSMLEKPFTWHSTFILIQFIFLLLSLVVFLMMEKFGYPPPYGLIPFGFIAYTLWFYLRVYKQNIVKAFALAMMNILGMICSTILAVLILGAITQF